LSVLLQVILSGFNETELNFGTVGSSSQKEAHFAVINNNPVAVLLKSWGINMTDAVVELVGVEEGNRSTALQRHSFSNMSTTVSNNGVYFFVTSHIFSLTPLDTREHCTYWFNIA
jgi:hypothetical protein